MGCNTPNYSTIGNYNTFNSYTHNPAKKVIFPMTEMGYDSNTKKSIVQEILQTLHRTVNTEEMKVFTVPRTKWCHLTYQIT